MATILNSRDFESLQLSKMGKDWLYNGFDSCLTHELIGLLKRDLGDSTSIYDFQLALMAPSLAMTLRGTAIDFAKRDDAVAALRAQMGKYEELLQRLVAVWQDAPLNHKSSPQLQNFFYKRMGIPPVMVRDKGESKVSCNEEALEKIEKTYMRAKPYCKVILKLREIQKELDVLEMTLDSDHRFRASFNVAGTVTGRWSSNKSPWGTGWNMQNIAKPPSPLREIFIPDPDRGYVMFYADLQAAESRAVAYISGDENYIRVCESGDIHTNVCRMVWPEIEWTGDIKKDRKIAETLEAYPKLTYRDAAKVFGHGSSYNGKAFTLGRQTGVPVKAVEAFQERFFGSFPGIRKWQLDTIQTIQTEGVLTTPFGRRRKFWSRLFDDSTLREGIAFVPQSFIGDYMNYGILRLYREKPGLKLLAQVHDAVLGMAERDIAEQGLVEPMIRGCLENIVEVKGRKMKIPIDINFGNNWGEIS